MERHEPIDILDRNPLSGFGREVRESIKTMLRDCYDAGYKAGQLSILDPKRQIQTDLPRREKNNVEKYAF